MSMHSRASSQGSRIKAVSIDKRIEDLQSLLHQVLQNSSHLKKLNELHSAMPEIHDTQKSLKQMQKDIEVCSRQMSEVQILNQKHSLNTQVNSLSRGIKLSTKTLNQLRQSIKQMNDEMPSLNQSRKLSECKEQLQCKSNIQPLLEKNKKQINSILKEFEEDCLTLQINGANKQVERKISDFVNSKKNNWNNQLKKLNTLLGSIKCQSAFIKDKHKKEKVSCKLNEILLQDLEIKDKNLALAMSQLAIELLELQLLVDVNILEISKQIQQIETQINEIGVGIKQESSQSQNYRQHFKREILYFGDRWFNLKNKIHGIKKKYLISMREIEQRFFSLKDSNTLNGKYKLDVFAKRMDILNQKFQEKLQNFDIKEESIQKSYIKMKKLNI